MTRYVVIHKEDSPNVTGPINVALTAASKIPGAKNSFIYKTMRMTCLELYWWIIYGFLPNAKVIYFCKLQRLNPSGSLCFSDLLIDSGIPNTLDTSSFVIFEIQTSALKLIPHLRCEFWSCQHCSRCDSNKSRERISNYTCITKSS